MGKMAEYGEQLREHARARARARVTSGDRSEWARVLGGEVEGRFVTFLFRGEMVSILPYGRDDFFVYDCLIGTWAAVKAHVRERAGLPAERPVGDRLAQALRIWAGTVPSEGTLAETYFRSRGISPPLPPSLRFHPRLYHSKERGHFPAMVASVVDAAESQVGIWRTYLHEDGRKIPREWQDKKGLGSAEGCAARLTPWDPRLPLLVGTGIETTLSGLALAGGPAMAWAALSDWGLRTLVLPREVGRVFVLADRDPGGGGKRAAEAAWARWEQEGRQAEVRFPTPPHKDFNDELRARST